MKIVRVDNFNRESVSDVLIATNVSAYYAGVIVQMLNKVLRDIHSAAFYKDVEDNYELHVFCE